MRHPRSWARRDFLRQAGVFSGGLITSLAAADVWLKAQQAQAQSDPDPVKFQLGWVKSIQFGGHFAAIENGYFAEENIEAEFQSGGPNIDNVSVVASGQTMLGDAGSNEIIFARAKGTPVKAFGCIFQKTPYALMSLSEEPVTTLQDMPGKTFAISDTGRPTIIALLEKEGLDPNEVRFVPSSPDPSVLATGQVDGYFGYATNQGIILQERGVDIEIVYTYDLGAPEYGNVFFTTDEVLETQKDLLIRWLRADIKGWQWAVENPEPLAELMVETYGQKGLDLEAQRTEGKAQIELIAGGEAEDKGLCWISPEVFDTAISLALNEFGAIDQPLATDEVMTTEILEAVYGDDNRVS